MGVIVALEMTDKFLDTVELSAWSTWVVGAANVRTAKGSIHVFFVVGFRGLCGSFYYPINQDLLQGC